MPCPSCWQSGNTGTLGPDARPGPISSQLMILPCFCSHSAFGTTTIPFPLQAFWPPQLPPARALALALVDAGALLLVAARLVLGAGLHRAAGEERRRRGGDEDALAHSIH